MKIKLKKVDSFLKEKLKDPYFKELYELEQEKTSLVKKIIDYRIKNDLTQEQLAGKVGITQQHISKIENNEFSSFPTLFRVLLYIGFKVKVEIEPIPLKPAEKRRIRYSFRKLQPA